MTDKPMTVEELIQILKNENPKAVLLSNSFVGYHIYNPLFKRTKIKEPDGIFVDQNEGTIDAFVL